MNTDVRLERHKKRILAKLQLYSDIVQGCIVQRMHTCGKPGCRRISQNVNLCDLFATLCELCDIPMPKGTDSRSLVPLLKGDDAAWGNETVSQFGGTNLMIKQDHLKYQYYGEDMPEVLFDLQKNPEETKNYGNDSAYKAEIERFRKRRAELGFGPDADPAYRNAGYNNENILF